MVVQVGKVPRSTFRYTDRIHIEKKRLYGSKGALNLRNYYQKPYVIYVITFEAVHLIISMLKNYVVSNIIIVILTHFLHILIVNRLWEFPGNAN